MRLWSLHPSYLDRQALTGGWREALLAQAVLAERTRGYRSHPQLERFREHQNPAAAIGTFLTALADEATSRGYNFDRSRIDRPAEPGAETVAKIPVTSGQMAYEWQHLLAKLEKRTPEKWVELRHLELPQPHPLFVKVPGEIASWERVS
ncbi:hypothetical protein HD598_001019 [Neomicrococcus aestuarii]|uniref:Pyrimidine dimer DNA glycosylase n=1 Tax=Neomicrococcus aestuarii TaxID=556325 RepID=A0A7W8WZJ7_9MICC|nr:pyrimidine dimer DNA glycosylase/endonuclease V [Neomicrococcus aestuarii]MBB5512332.1 hypothetical protein [Neomicrococcus aestuarii]